MRSPSKRDRGFQHANPECMIWIAIIGILAAVSMPLIIEIQHKRDLACVQTLIGLRTEAEPEGTCPKTDAAYELVEQEDGRRILRCSQPDEHSVVSEVDLIRDEGQESWRLRQTLEPIDVDGEVDLDDGETPSDVITLTQEKAVRVRVQNSGFTRYGLGGVVGLVFLLFVYATVLDWRDRPNKDPRYATSRPRLVVNLLIAALVLLGLEYRIHREDLWTVREGQVTHQVRCLGWEDEVRTIDGAVLVVPVSAGAGSKSWIQLIHREDGELTHEEMFELDSEQVGAVAVIQSALAPAPPKPKD